MDSKYYDLIEKLYSTEATFYTLFGASIAEAKIIGLSGDYVILETSLGGQNLTVHSHYSQVEVIGSV
ncbi:hypothetical protein [Vibrio parahaemolyticus]|uniref:hypothetical protein n=1 Tax=Vibrio parahaemolyticus TaxID=670 RepID=UPI00111F47E8|nr:hypothetical protein [Vibrio parahaemolyticus]MCG6506686.1 hypothetical protein [Vibrio parahaemolyticus]TOH64275.1 hypothetical protein CGI78_02315 [Vibrio parahaemolyticus]TOI44244.1 hypothetical protein CGI61_02545 [Vibrio parahaemolyticus]TOO38012.1 hypothetical protein CGH37_02645 [Vibrio parahaemolyticus]TOO39728.1 hypothetical protein CGH36_23440 [Vibrio parahaemolyticus]